MLCRSGGSPEPLLLDDAMILVRDVYAVQKRGLA